MTEGSNVKKLMDKEGYNCSPVKLALAMAADYRLELQQLYKTYDDTPWWNFRARREIQKNILNKQWDYAGASQLAMLYAIKGAL